MLRLSRRQLVRAGGLLTLLATLPPALVARITSRPPPTSDFDDSATAEQVTAGLDLSGMTYAITGCNSGLGFETMRVLALRGARVIGIARSAEKAQLACAAVDGETVPEHLDLMDWESVVLCADRIRRHSPVLDGLVCNAGIVAVREREIVHGVEKQFCVNHLGHFILANQLLDQIVAADQGRFVFVSSRAHRQAPEEGILFDDLAWEHTEYDPQVAYGHSKLANALCSRALAARLSETNATANSLHPGVIVTNAIRNMDPWMQRAAQWLGWMFTKTVEEGAATQTYLTAHPDLAGVRGYYFDNCNVGEGTRFLTDDAMAERLWQVSRELTHRYLPVPTLEA